MPQVLNKHKDKIQDGDVYIGRPSKFGNPIAIGKDCSRDEAVYHHWQYLHGNKKLLRVVRSELPGKNLVCFCAPAKCHGDTLMRVANAPTVVERFDKDYAFLSNFYPCTVVGKSGIVYPSSEHAYQAAKSKSRRIRKIIASLPTAAATKKYGRNVVVRPDWEKVKRRIMLQIVRAKFSQNRYLAMMLIDTLDADLREGNWWGDTTWGICKGVGKNWLGKILMQVRAELRLKLLGY